MCECVCGIYVFAEDRNIFLTTKDSDVDSETSGRLIRVQSKSRFALPYSWPDINWIVA